MSDADGPVVEIVDLDAAGRPVPGTRRSVGDANDTGDAGHTGRHDDPRWPGPPQRRFGRLTTTLAAAHLAVLGVAVGAVATGAAHVGPVVTAIPADDGNGTPQSVGRQQWLDRASPSPAVTTADDTALLALLPTSLPGMDSTTLRRSGAQPVADLPAEAVAAVQADYGVPGESARVILVRTRDGRGFASVLLPLSLLAQTATGQPGTAVDPSRTQSVASAGFAGETVGTLTVVVVGAALPRDRAIALLGDVERAAAAAPA